MKTTPVINEAIRLLHISDKPGLYKSIRRWARQYIKRAIVAPIDVISWPKGCLMLGLSHQAFRYMDANTSQERALSIMCMGEVKGYIDTWIREGAKIYTIDDCLAGCSLLSLADMYKQMLMSADDNEPDSRTIREDYEKYKAASDKMMAFLYSHDKDGEGSLPYRPIQKTGEIFADGAGMVLPFAIHYGLVNNDDNAISLGMNQIRNFIKNATDPDTGLLYHAYSKSDDTKCLGAIGWGRAIGWIMFGIEHSIRILKEKGYIINADGERECILTFTQYGALRDLKEIRKNLISVLQKYRRSDGMFGCIIPDSESLVDTSASAMILYAFCGENPSEETTVIASFDKYTDSEGHILAAQGECMGLGLYSENFTSYPWSVGMALLFDI